jgi:DNA-binding response OmpR family regulator
MIGRAMRMGLVAVGFVVDWVTNGNAAEAFLAANSYDVAVLDLAIPLQDGLAVLRKLRERGSRLPVLVASAGDTASLHDISIAAGADAFLPKPFDLDELTDRTLALAGGDRQGSRRSAGSSLLTMDAAAKVVEYRHRRLDLADGEFAALEALLRAPQGVVSFEEFEAAYAGEGSRSQLPPASVVVATLNAKFGHRLIRIVRGVGYRLSI